MLVHTDESFSFCGYWDMIIENSYPFLDSIFCYIGLTYSDSQDSPEKEPYPFLANSIFHSYIKKRIPSNL